MLHFYFRCSFRLHAIGSDLLIRLIHRYKIIRTTFIWCLLGIMYTNGHRGPLKIRYFTTLIIKAKANENKLIIIQIQILRLMILLFFLGYIFTLLSAFGPEKCVSNVARECATVAPPLSKCYQRFTRN